jgi:hypothetical protein
VTALDRAITAAAAVLLLVGAARAGESGSEPGPHEEATDRVLDEAEESAPAAEEDVPANADSEASAPAGEEDEESGPSVERPSGSRLEGQPPPPSDEPAELDDGEGVPPAEDRAETRQAEPAPPLPDADEQEEVETPPAVEVSPETPRQAEPVPGQAEPPPAPSDAEEREESVEARPGFEGPRETARPADPAPPAEEAAEPEEEEELAARALQRSLVERGALLLPVWGFELVPGFSYRHSSGDAFVTVPGQADPTAPVTTLGVRRRSHQLTGVLTSRLGLPWNLQLEASAPFQWISSGLVVGGLGRSDASGAGLGDPRLSLSWQLVRARGALPDLLVAGTWKPRVGSSPFDAGDGEVGLGSGFHAVGATLTASKAADPLVFLASASYTANLGVSTEQGRRDPGDSWGLGAGAILAVSPETSMSFLVDFSYRPEDRLRGEAVLGSDETAAVLQLGVATVVSRRAVLNFTVGIGLTEDSPDLQLGVSVPLRFFEPAGRSARRR